ncbi:MAG TPA: alpha/beta hydrolase [Burkholderiaceae bacterium]
MEVTPLSGGTPNQLEGSAPDRVYKTVQRAELHSFTVAAPRARVLLCAGGGYVSLAYEREGAEVATWLNAAGFDAHVLVHRLPGSAGHPPSVALTDGMAALVHLQSLPVLPLFLMGLSSGGHLAGVLACQPEARHALGLLIAYAPLNANHRDHKAPVGKPDYPPPEKQAFYDAWPIGIASERHGLPPQPIFLTYALHDKIVPIEHALNIIRSARDAGLDLDAHVFNDAPHGFALRDLEGAQRHWPGLALDWMERRLGN